MIDRTASHTLDPDTDAEQLDAPAPIYPITGIIANARHAGRFDIVVQGDVAAVLSLDAIDRLGVRIGAQWTPALADRAAVEQAALRTFDRAVYMLAARPRATRDLERQLARKGEPAEHIATAVARLTALGALNDASYARAFIRAKMSGAGLSRRRLQSELWRRGVAREVIDDALAEVLVEDDVDEDAQLVRVAEKKLRTLKSLEPAVARRRLYGFLARRGYDASAIRRLMETLPGESLEHE